MKLKAFMMIAVTLLDIAFYAGIMRGTATGHCAFAKFGAHKWAQSINVRQ